MCRVLIASSWVWLIIVVLAPRCLADSIYFNDEGRKHFDALRLRIAPAEIFEDPVRKLPYIRGFILSARPARNLAAGYKTVEGSPEYEFVAFDASGERRSQAVTISQAWVHHVMADLDTELDVRALFSDRDRLAGVALGSRTYFAMARRAADPDRKLGLWRGDVTLPPEPPGVTEGTVIRFILDPPVRDASGQAQAWQARRSAAETEWIKQSLAQRLPTAHLLAAELPLEDLVSGLIDAIARERAYRLSDAGFDRTALSMLVFVFDLALVNHREKPSSDHAADVVYSGGVAAIGHAVGRVSAAAPLAIAEHDPQELVTLMQRYNLTQDPAEARRLTAEFDAMQARLDAERRAACVKEAPLCLDPSQRAAVAIDALMASEGLYKFTYLHARLTNALVAIQTTPPGPRPRRNDRIDLRDAASKLLVQLVNPPPGPDAASQRRRQACAKLVRAHLRGIVINDLTAEHTYTAAREALAAGGWGSPEELSSLVRVSIENATSYASRESEPGRPDVLAMRERRSARQIATLRALADLAGSSVDHERRAASAVIEFIEEVRRRRNKGQAHTGDKVVLEAWDLVSGKR